MTKVKNPDFEKINEFKPPAVYSKRTIKKSGGDDFNKNVRSVKPKSKKKK